MKIVVFSDVHGEQRIVERILGFNPDRDFTLSLGDSELRRDYLENLNIILVRGNYPRDPGQFYDRDITIGGKKIFMTHGHKWGVRRGVAKLGKMAMERGYDVVLYGHTHIAALTKIHQTFIINPGSARSPRTSLPPTYLIIEINKGDMTFTFKDAFTNQTIEVS